MSGESEKPQDGGPAFPVLHPSCQRVNETEMCDGMTLRDWFAGQAMLQVDAGPNRPECYAEAARWCYEMADAMLKERSNGR